MAALKTKTMGTTKFGWCLDGYHDDCWVTNGEQVCSCPCHGRRNDHDDEGQRPQGRSGLDGIR